MADLLRKQVDDFKRGIVIAALKETGGNIAAVGRKFGRNKSSMYNTLRILGVNAKDYRPQFETYLE